MLSATTLAQGESFTVRSPKGNSARTFSPLRTTT